MVRTKLGYRARRSARIEICESRIALTASTATLDVFSAEPMSLASDQLPLSGETSDTPLRRWLHENRNLTGRGQTVAVIDSGIAYDHAALGGGLGEGFKVVGGWDFTEENDADPYDDAPAGFHGTHVAGILASEDPQHPGLAPEVDLVGLRVFNDQGESDFRWIEKALQWVHAHRNDFRNPITTVNISIGSEMAVGESEWGILEDEFEQLVADDIFIAVAAGNDFEADPTIGLSHPADSPYVIPVGSHGPDGTLSKFSQRAEGMLVAPGEQVYSTITDFIDDFNGVTDDWMALSGTSMATPYVAGAAVLVRQALAQSGMRSVGQREIYDRLSATADLIEDAVTGMSYRRVNLRAAIEGLLPVNQPVEDLGQVGYYRQGRQLSDRGEDQFVFNATRDGILTISADNETNRAQLLQATLTREDGSEQSLRRDESTLRLDINVRAGERLSLQLNGQPGANIDLTIANLLSLDATDRLHVAADFQIENLRVRSTPTLQLTIDQLRYDFGTTETRGIRIDASAGTRVFLIGSPFDDQLSLADGTVRLTARDADIVVVGGEAVRVHGGGGSDTADMTVTDQNARLVSRSDFSRLRAPDQMVEVARFSQVNVRFAPAYSEGNVGHRANTGAVAGRPAGPQHAGPLAHLTGTPSNDTLTARGNTVRLKGNGYQVTATRFDRVFALGGGGNADEAFLHGTEANETFVTDSVSARLTGGDTFWQATDFDNVFAYGHGGMDRALFRGSVADERLTWTTAAARYAGKGFQRVANGFDRIDARGGGGRDEVFIVGDAADEVFRTDGQQLRWGQRTGRVLGSISDFASVNVRGGGGRDELEVTAKNESAKPLHGDDWLGLASDQMLQIFREVALATQ